MDNAMASNPENMQQVQNVQDTQQNNYDMPATIFDNSSAANMERRHEPLQGISVRASAQ